MDVYSELNEVFQDVFDSPELKVTVKTTADDVEDWDSVTHINLICAVEDRFGISFTSREIASLDCVGNLVEILNKKRRTA